MADWSKILTSEVYATLLASVKGMIYDVAKGLDSAKITATNLPVDAIRWSSANARWEIFNGTTWVVLKSAYAINISGNAATVTNGLYTTDLGVKVPWANGTGSSGTWGISILGNAATASVASAVPWSGITAKPTTVAGYGITDIQSYVFPSGTRMPFAQASAPTGWTQDTSDAASNRMLRVVSSAGGGVGGSHSPILNNVVPAHTHGFSTGYVSSDHSHSGSTGGRSAAHTHTWSRAVGSGSISGSYTANMTSSVNQQGTESVTTGTESADHAHGFTTGGGSANHYHSGSTDNGSSQVNWSPRYIDLIICTKN